jgi:Holliday junction resolvase-like predicted endonuclease
LKHAFLALDVQERSVNLSTRSGRRGEQRVESWLNDLGWSCSEKNLRIPGGEIDRLFFRRVSGLQPRIDICIAEIKTTSIRSLTQFGNIFSEASLKTLVRPHQMRNLWRTAQIEEMRVKRQNCEIDVCTYVRYFLVVFASERIIVDVRKQIKAGRNRLPVRICHADDDVLILSWSPDVPAQNF